MVRPGRDLKQLTAPLAGRERRGTTTDVVVVIQQEKYVVIVAGVFTVDPGQRDAFLASRMDRMRTSRAEQGCLEYTFSADPLDPGRVLLYERWASQDDLDAHLAVPAAPMPAGAEVTPASASIVVYDITGERPLGR